MRKFSSTVNTAFISEAGRQLINNDDFGFVELDKFACYVVADSIGETNEEHSAARLAIYSIIRKFTERPSMSKKAVQSYLREANRQLFKEKSDVRLKASVTVMVTDYMKLRYGQAGNTRLQFYRDGTMRVKSRDQSLSQAMVKTGELTPEKLAWHEERNNLTCYAGMGKGFHPVISKKITLLDGDLFALYTRGVWENVDEGELSDVLAEVGKDVKEPIDTIEDMLLSKQPKKLENYTFVLIAFEKIFKDPNRKKRIKKIVIISLIVVVVALLIWLVTWIVLRVRANWTEDMNLAYANTIEYIQDENYVRAKEECASALKLAEKLRDKKMRLDLGNYQKLIEGVITADDAYADGKYTDAQTAYINAKERARYADNIGTEHIDKRLEDTRDFLAVSDALYLGDRQQQNGDYQGAEEKYLEAKNLASRIYFEDGKKQALDALNKLYEDQAKQKEADTEEAKAKSETELTAADMLKEGDLAFLNGDIESAKVYYNIAMEKYTDVGDETRVESIKEKMASLDEKELEKNYKTLDALTYEKAALDFYAAGNYMDAKKQYLFAKNLYAELGEDDKVKEIDQTLEIIDLDSQKAEKEAAEKAAKKKLSSPK